MIWTKRRMEITPWIVAHTEAKFSRVEVAVGGGLVLIWKQFWMMMFFPIGVAIVMMMMMTLAIAVFFVSFAVTRRWKSCTMDSSQLCAAHCQWPDDSFNARHIKHQQQHQKCNSLHDFHLEWQKLSLLRLFSPLLPSLPGSP